MALKPMFIMIVKEIKGACINTGDEIITNTNE